VVDLRFLLQQPGTFGIEPPQEFRIGSHLGRQNQGQLQACGAITGSRKLPWRFRWPD
jgi:hypothetical protein